MKPSILLLLAALSLAACDNAGLYKGSTPPKWQAASIEVTWLANDEAVTKKCQELGLPTTGVNGCARSKPDNIAICEVYVVQPRDFNDSSRLEVLGHEVLHCLGARHD
jgi:hypothetical protein